jgi:hypothetical protein
LQRDNPGMIPMRNSTIFKSRWMALLWAAGIIWFAYDFAASQPQDGNSSANASSDDANKIAQELNSF